MQWLWKWFGPKIKVRPGASQYRFKYQRYPLDHWQYFTVLARSQDEANEKAKARHENCYPA